MYQKGQKYIFDYLTKKQQRGAASKPDFIWQFAQHLKKEYAQKGKDIQVFVNAYVSVNGKPSKQKKKKKKTFPSTLFCS